MSVEHKRKISLANLGKPKPKLLGNKNAIGMKPNRTSFKKGQTSGNDNINWKGEKVGYNALHSWIYRNIKRPEGCEKCGTNDINSYKGHWHNISHKYKRVKEDWELLCAKCHRLIHIKG